LELDIGKQLGNRLAQQEEQYLIPASVEEVARYHA
jgi:hypothetical protein